MEIQASPLKKSSSGHVNPRSKYRVDLPVEIVFEILSRIPAKDLLRFETICKSWYSLISTPRFVKSHLAHARAHQEIIFEVSETIYRGSRMTIVNKYLSMNLQDQTIQPELSLALEALKVEHKTGPVEFLGSSCDGLLVFGKPLSVYNPVTRKYKDLPPLPEFDGPCITLVYDDSIDKYKVFALDFFRTKGFFFTLGRDSSLWRELAESLLPYSPGQNCLLGSNFLFVGCELHWAMMVFAILDDGTEVKSEMHFFSMDVREEKFKKIELPIRETPLGQRDVIYLSELKGRICLTNILDDELDIQMLETHDSTCQWTTLCNIKLDALFDKPDVLRSFLSGYRNINVFCVPSRNSDDVSDLVKVFIQDDGKLLFYDFKTNVLQQIRSVSSERHYGGRYVFHANSLVSWE